MKKGFEWPIGILLGLVLLIFVVAVFFSTLRNENVRQITQSNQPQSEFCDSDEYCNGKPDGEKCLQLYSFETGGNPFCGCLKNTDCTGGKTCGSENKCE